MPSKTVTRSIQFKCGGFWRLKSVKGTYSLVTEKRTRKTVEKKTPDAPPAKGKIFKSRVYFRSINVCFPSMLDKKS